MWKWLLSGGNSSTAIFAWELLYCSQSEWTRSIVSLIDRIQNARPWRELGCKIMKSTVKNNLKINVWCIPVFLLLTGKMNEVVPLHGDLMCSICYMLNKSSNALKNWRHLASELGIDHNTYKSFEPESPQSPTSILLEWVCSEKGNEFTVREFCKTLARIKRYDVIELLEIEFGQNFRQPSQS